MYCYNPANFQADSKKNPEAIEFKDKKREILIELIDILDDNQAYDYLLNEEILKESMIMITKNISRTFSNKSKFFYSFLNLNFDSNNVFSIDNKK